MPVQLRSLRDTQRTLHAAVIAIVCAGVMACSGGGSPNGPSSGGSNTGGTTGPPCRTASANTSSLQTFATGQTVSTDSSCSLNADGTQATCTGKFVDSVGGPGTFTQTGRFASRSDVVDEASTNPPRSLSLGTTTI